MFVQGLQRSFGGGMGGADALDVFELEDAQQLGDGDGDGYGAQSAEYLHRQADDVEEVVLVEQRGRCPIGRRHHGATKEGVGEHRIASEPANRFQVGLVGGAEGGNQLVVCVAKQRVACK